MPLTANVPNYRQVCCLWNQNGINNSLLSYKFNLHSLAERVHYNIYRSAPLPRFEECLQRLEKIVQELENGDVPLEKSLTLFEEGMQLSNSCRKELEEAEGKVEILLKNNGKLQAEPFEPLTDKASSK